MNQRLHKHATPADADPGQRTTLTKAVVAVSDNNHNGMLVLEEDIRLCAYQKWEAAGHPTGDGIRFWLEAEQELVEGKNENSVQRVGWHGHHEHERLDAEKAVKESHAKESHAKESHASVDSHYRDNNRMFQSHGERGHRHGSR
jgi:hypothetical protein